MEVKEMCFFVVRSQEEHWEPVSCLGKTDTATAPSQELDCFHQQDMWDTPLGKLL